MLMKKIKYKKDLIKLYNEFMRYKIYDNDRCTLCKTCIHSKLYNEETEIFKQLEKKMGFFYECKNPRANITSTLKYACNLYAKGI